MRVHPFPPSILFATLSALGKLGSFSQRSGNSSTTTRSTVAYLSSFLHRGGVARIYLKPSFYRLSALVGVREGAIGRACSSSSVGGYDDRRYLSNFRETCSL